MNIIGYCRVSTDNQKEEGTILIQRQYLEDYAAAQGHQLLKVFSDEGVSGGAGGQTGPFCPF